MTPKQYKELLRSQQGETNAVLMYKRLAQVVKTEREREAFLQLAREEGRHASVFHAYTKQVLKPQKTMAVVLPLLYRLLGKRWLYRTIAKGEYIWNVDSDDQIVEHVEKNGKRKDRKGRDQNVAKSFVVTVHGLGKSFQKYCTLFPGK